MLKKIFFISCLLSIFILSSCEKENKIDTENPNQSERVNLTIKVVSEEAPPAYEDFKVEITELRSSEVTEGQLDVNGVCSIELDKATYTIVAQWKNDSVSFFGNKESYSLTKSDTLEISLTKIILIDPNPTPEPKMELVFKEIFFNGETNHGQKMHPDQYFVIYNNGDQKVYADGVTFAISARANFNEADVITEFLPDNFIAGLFYSIPGNGTDYPLEPGEQLVIAATAINHQADGNNNSADLSGADFEAYDPEENTDVDNPNVPNLIAHFSAWGRFIMHPKGFMVPIIFKPDTDMETFMADNKVEFQNSNGNPIFLYKVPTNLILDGIETGSQGSITVKSLPPFIDKGSATIAGCHAQQLIQRKKGENGKLMDTNDSNVDCEKVIGQNSFPADKSKGIFIAPERTPIVHKDIDNCEINQFKYSTWNALK